MPRKQQPLHQRPLPVEASELQSTISCAVHAARAASSRSTPMPVPSGPRPRPTNNVNTAAFSQRHADFRSFTPQQQRPAAGSAAVGSSNSLKKLVAGLKEIHRAAPENDTAVLSREVREWYRERKEEKKEKVAAQVRAHVKLLQREEEEVQRLLKMQEEQYRWRQEQLQLQQQQQLLVQKRHEAPVTPRIEVTAALEEDWRSVKGGDSPPEQFYDFVVRERASDGQRPKIPGAGATVPAAAVNYHGAPREPLHHTHECCQAGHIHQTSEHGSSIDRAAPRAGRLLYASERLCYGPNEQYPVGPSQPDDLDVIISKIHNIKTDIMEGRQRQKAAKAARRLASQESKEKDAREKWRQDMKTRIGGPRLLVAGEEQRGISAGVRQSLDEISPVRSPISPLRRHSIASPVSSRTAAPPGRIKAPQVLPSPLESRKLSPPAFYSHNASRVTQWDDFVNPRPTPPPPAVLAPLGTASSSSSALAATSTSGFLSSSPSVSTSTPLASSSSKYPFSISASTATSTPKSTFSSFAFKPTLPKLFTRGIAALPQHCQHQQVVSTTSSGASSTFGCRGISAGAKAKGVAAMMMRAARAASVSQYPQQQQQQQNDGERDESDGPFRSPLAPICRVSPLAVGFGERRASCDSVSFSSTGGFGGEQGRCYGVVSAMVPSPLNVRKTATPTPLMATCTAKARRHSGDFQVNADGEQCYKSAVSISSSPSSDYNGEDEGESATKGTRSRSRSSPGAESTFSRPSWWTWGSASPSPTASRSSLSSSQKQKGHVHRGVPPSVPNLLVEDVDAAPPPSQKPAASSSLYSDSDIDSGSDFDAESLYRSPPPRRLAPPFPLPLAPFP